jgi:hypothetical protein
MSGNPTNQELAASQTFELRRSYRQLLFVDCDYHDLRGLLEWRILAEG